MHMQSSKMHYIKREKSDGTKGTQQEHNTTTNITLTTLQQEMLIWR